LILSFCLVLHPRNAKTLRQEKRHSQFWKRTAKGLSGLQQERKLSFQQKFQKSVIDELATTDIFIRPLVKRAHELTRRSKK